MCGGVPPTAAVLLQDEIKAFLKLDYDSDDVLGMLKLSECESRSVGEVCLPVACPEIGAGSALEVKREGAGEVPVPVCFDSSGRVAKIRGHGRFRRRPSSDICLVNAFTHKCKGVRPLPIGTQEIDGEAFECGKASHAMEDASSGVGVFRAACQVEKARHDFLSVLSDGDVSMKAGAMRKRSRRSVRKRPRRSKGLSLAGNGEAITKNISVPVRGKRLLPVGLEERTYHFLTTVAPGASFCSVYEYTLKRYRRASLGLNQLYGLIEMQRSSDIVDSGCMEQELDRGIAPTASVRSDVDVIDVSDDDAYTRSSDVTSDRTNPPVFDDVVKQETYARRPLPSDAPLVMKAEPKPEIKREPGERRVVSSRVSLAKVSAASVASPHAHTALKVEASTSWRREGSGQLVLTHPPVGSVMVETREQQPVKREAPTPDPHVR